jgi:hypothetical protein
MLLCTLSTLTCCLLLTLASCLPEQVLEEAIGVGEAVKHATESSLLCLLLLVSAPWPFPPPFAPQGAEPEQVLEETMGALASGVNKVERQVGKVTGEVDLPEFPTKELENLGAKVEAGAGRAESEGKEMGDRMSEQVRGAGQPAGTAGQGPAMRGQAGQVQWGAGRAGLGAIMTRGRQVDGCRQGKAVCNAREGGHGQGISAARSL